MRLDAHHSFSDRYPLAVLETILKRNRFDGSVLIAPSVPDPLPSFVRAVVLETSRLDPGPLPPIVRGLSSAGADCAELERRRLTLDFPGDPALIPAIAALHPDLRIALPLSAAADLAALARFPNVYCKLAGIVSNQRPLVERAIDAFGPQRLMFGSHWPVLLPEHAWKASLAGFTQSIGARTIEFREQLLGGTAAHFYRIAE